MSFWTYVLRSEITSRLYVGSCADLNDRLYRHNSGQSKATMHGVPWKLVHSEPFETRSDAVRREQFFKTGKGRDELARILLGDNIGKTSLAQPG